MAMERQEILEALQRRIQLGGGKVLQTVKSLAEEFDVKPERMYYLIRAFEKSGQISTTSHGPNGMELRVGSGEPRAVTGRARRPRAAAAPAAAAPARARSASGARYCPYCGRESEADWRYCTACGQQLPAAR